MNQSYTHYEKFKAILKNAFQKGNEQSAELKDVMRGLESELDELFNQNEVKLTKIRKNA